MRESTMLKSEEFKTHVRLYMESLGFAQTTDAFTEGHLADMVFVPIDDRSVRIEQWVEAKATGISLRDEDFAREVKSYLAEWLIRRPEIRFRLWLFIIKLRNLPRWHEVFGEKLSGKAVFEWLHELKYTTKVIEERIQSADPSVIVSFFSESMVVEAESSDLDMTVSNRLQTSRSLMGSLKRTQDLLKAMEKHAQPFMARSTLIANLICFEPPLRYIDLEIEPMTLVEIKSAFRGLYRPPFSILSKNHLLAIESDTTISDFSPVKAKLANTLALDEAESLYESQLLALLNRGIDFIVRRCAVRHNGKCYYFRASREVQKGKSRTIRARGTVLTVAVPKYREDPSHIEEPSGMLQYGPLYARPAFKDHTDLNYVYHEGFTVRCRHLWGSYFFLIHLHRAFTDDGENPLEGSNAARLDEAYRKPEYNRADSQIRKLEVMAAYLFGSDRISTIREPWVRQFHFGSLLNIPIQWEPSPVDLQNTDLFESDSGLMNIPIEEEDNDH
jgi:hypothetical protein